jgi:hypothetical protein
MKKVNNKRKPIFVMIFITITILGILFIFLRGNEDNWIKNSKGIWIKHGNPAETPSEVKSQQQIIACATDIYSQFKKNGMVFSSQCLGACGNYSIDIVHVPRTSEDDKIENQCEEYLNGKTNHFLELNKEGNIIRII